MSAGSSRDFQNATSGSRGGQPGEEPSCGHRQLDIRARKKIPASHHYRRPPERPFTAAERNTTTVLLGGLTRNHERFIQAVFRGCGYSCELLPTPDQMAFQIGKEYGNNGQCSPAYFTAGSLIRFLKGLEAKGMSRSDIIGRYLFFTAGSCGPCRFGMYAAEYRLALQNAGFDGFRVIRFQQDHGVRQQSHEPGLTYTLDFGLGMLKALFLGDLLNDIVCNLRPYEIQPGETDRVMNEIVDDLCEHLRTYKPPEPMDVMPSCLARLVANRKIPRHMICVPYKVRRHLRGEAFIEALHRCRDRIGRIKLDRTRVKPIVKIVGEFWAQTTEGDGNYRMFEFLEREGAQVQPEAIGTWLTYLMSQARRQLQPRRGLNEQGEEPRRWGLRQRARIELGYQERRALLWLGEWAYTRLYHRMLEELGAVAHRLVPQDRLARLADPFYRTLARGGEGYLEVGKNIYYNLNRLCHMVLSLKPFGCMPSSQSDGIQSAVVNRFKDMIFLPIETSGEGEVNAHSRVQMALGEAKLKAKSEFQRALSATGKPLEEIRAFVEKHPELRSPLYRVPRYSGYAGLAASFILHVNNLMKSKMILRPLRPGIIARKTCFSGENRLIPPAAGQYRVGLDVGSTTVKAVVVNAQTAEVLWQDYRRHDTRLAEMTLDFLHRAEREVGISPANARIFITGSGGNRLAPIIGAKPVQEVLAACLEVGRVCPKAGSMVEVGGQDAKIVIFKRESADGQVKKIPSMNDKCAGGTGAVIDKISRKLGISERELSRLRYSGIRLHPVAGKCGVFAETDINGLQKQGIPPAELMASLFEAFVLQNLKVLARGNTLMPHVVLLGGANHFIPGMREAWQRNIALMWQERGVRVPDARPEELIYAPDNAQYYGALGAAEYGKDEEYEVGRYLGTSRLESYLSSGRIQSGARGGVPGLVASKKEEQEFLRTYAPPIFVPPSFVTGERVRGFIGVDAGSTSTKAVLVSKKNEVLVKAYQLSKGNPIEDTVEILEKLRAQVEGRGASIEVLGVATTGYAKDTLRDVICADVALVETVAHAKSALHYYDQPDVICDVGGQDIKLIILKDGRVKDFKFNTQCSAGNGYFLQAIAHSFGFRVEQYADAAFSARSIPVFPYGCAIFLQSDIAGFLGQGWSPHEILAGLAAVLPKNIWLYVAKIPNLPELGTRFILQGGTQNNLAAVKAQVDFIRSRFQGSGKTPQITVHKHAGEAGAIGAAFEAMRLWQEGRKTTFIGLDAVRRIKFRTTVGDATRCGFCKNHCVRTFIDIYTGEDATEAPAPGDSKIELRPGERRLIVANCEKGSAESLKEMKAIQAGLDAAREANPNLVEFAGREVWKIHAAEKVADKVPRRAFTKTQRVRRRLMRARESFRLGIPRVMGMYAYAPLFSVYFESLGILPGNIVWSDFTSEEMYRLGAKRGAIDPCYPSKLALAHVHNLIFVKHQQKRVNCIFFPMFDVLRSPLVNMRATNACPTTALTPEVVKAAYTKETDVFAEHGIVYSNPLLDLSRPHLLARQMLAELRPLLGLSEAENMRAVSMGYEALKRYEAAVRLKGRELLDRLEREGGVGIVLLGRPYHHDAGINQGIPGELQRRGYPVFSQSTLPLDQDLLERLFGEEVGLGIIPHPLDITDVWKHTFSANSAYKLWAAKFTARHPNLIAVELSNFKCGHDAPIYTTIERIIESSGTPYFAFKDIDENRPAGSIKLRVETIDYFLKRYQEELAASKVEENFRIESRK